MDDEKEDSAPQSERDAGANRNAVADYFKLYSQLRIPAIEALSDSIKEFQFRVGEITKQFVIPEIKSISLLTSTLGMMAKANQIRDTKYPAMAENLKEAAEYCWFDSVLMDFRSREELAFIADGVDAENRQHVIETAYADEYRGSFSYLSETISSMFPHRAFALNPAYGAHLRGEYALSIPVLLAQAEGILREITSSELFSARPSPIKDFAKKQRDLVTLDNNWLRFSDDAIWAQLSGDLPIGWSQKLRDENGYTGFNRNTTLHGIDLHYATEINSLKAFSLLCHVAGIAEWLEEDDDAK
ncbi:hypothetical protein [Pseudomonas siliginis]|uniref:hypothetical protein n=1 Tax=Pseudomonas siliginis TaxID=2842346 RepID=UPI003D64D4FC